MDEKTIGIRLALKEVCENKTFANNPQNIHTPYALSEEMIGKLREFVNLKDKTILLLNLEFVEELRYLGFNTETMYFATACKEKAGLLKHSRYNGVNLIFGDYLTLNTTNMKFDVIVGNPPYNAPQNAEGKRGGGDTFWDKFVTNSFELLKPNGYLCFVHPMGWRAPVGDYTDVKDSILSNNLLFLSMNDSEKGLKVFGAGTAYDYYVCQKASYGGKTKFWISMKNLPQWI